MKMKKNNVLMAVAGLVLALAPTAQADLIITVFEDTVNDKVDFAWNGIIGASGSATSLPGNGGSADQIVPETGNVQAADRSRSDVSGTGGGSWSPSESYAGSTSAYGTGIGTATPTGGGFSTFDVTSDIPFFVRGGDGALRVGHITAGGSTFPDLATQVFTGSFSLDGDFSDYGLFDTAPTSLTSNPTVPFWTATAGGATGSIVFAAIPEPGTMSLLAIGGLGVLLMRRRLA